MRSSTTEPTGIGDVFPLESSTPVAHIVTTTSRSSRGSPVETTAFMLSDSGQIG